MSAWLLRAGWVLFTPLWALVTALHPRTRASWAGRWAWRLPPVAPGAVWVHASSVGEGQAAAALCQALRESPERPVLLRTASTDTGLETARGHHVLAPRPVDAPWVVGRWLDRVRPRLLVLVEGDLWPGLMLGCAARDIPVVVVGLKDGQGSRRLRRLAPGLFACMASAVRLWLVRERVPGLPGQVEVIDELKGLPGGLTPVTLDRPTLVAGSTRDGDEAALLAAWLTLSPRPLLVLAPRHPVRFDAVAALLDQAALAWHRWSVDPSVPADCAVVLVDTVGDLPAFYPEATAAFVGGTFDAAIGGHSPAEPAAAGLGLVHGPHTRANAAAWAGLATHPAPGPDALGLALAAALAAGRAVPQVSDGPRQAARRLTPWLSGPIPAERPLRPWLCPLGWVFGALAGWRGVWLARRGATRLDVPVISVGGLGSGGAGKTPAVGHLVRRLEARGRRPAVVSRGYGRRASGPAVRTGHDDAGAAALGDELAMLAARGVAVVSAPDRLAGARAAVQQGADVVVLDDGFQHRGLHRDADVVVVDPRWPTEGGPLPVGEARESLAALGRADLLWLSAPGVAFGAPEGLPRVRSQVVPTGWVHCGERLPLAALPPGPVTAFAGLARPGRFLAQLVALGVDVRAWQAWPDHHPWTPEEAAALVAEAGESTLVCSEKDLARLSPDVPAWALVVELAVVSGEPALEQLLDRVLA